MDLFCCIVLTTCHKGCFFVIYLTFLYFLPEVIGRKIAHEGWKLNEKIKCLKGDLYIDEE